MLLKGTETAGVTVANVLARQVALKTSRQVAKVTAINLAVILVKIELILLFRD